MAEDMNVLEIPEKYKDIAPITDAEFKDKIKELISVPEFESVVKYVMPEVDYSLFKEGLLSLENKDDFQLKIMIPLLSMLEFKTTNGIDSKGIDKLDLNQRYTFITNHRDIVLDACFLNVCLHKKGHQSTEVAIGNNLLIYQWIDTLVRINKSFIVKRNLGVRQALEAAIQLSGYIHFAITDKKQSVWIAQREGRAKDSDDRTQESLLKMLAIAGSGNVVDRLSELNICPVALCYEYDPNDYLKAKEYILKIKNPDYKKSKSDDLLSMRTGILNPKGRIRMNFGTPINEILAKIEDKNNKLTVYKEVANIIDNEIHSNYEIFECNYIAFDKKYNTSRFSEKYTEDDIAKFDDYMNSQITKIDVEALTNDDLDSIKDYFLTMYSNPLRNQMKVQGLL